MAARDPSGRDDPELWVFGYGSLVWRPAIPHTERRPAHVRGWARRFWQGSTDHRGVPEAPGRVVTLMRAPGERCWGMAYRIAQQHAESVLATLDHREKGGYSRHRTVLYAGGGEPFGHALLYVATPDNPAWLGPAPLAEMAAQVLASAGPSGPNLEYVVELARALREMGAEDAHVFELAEEVARRRGDPG